MQMYVARRYVMKVRILLCMLRYHRIVARLHLIKEKQAVMLQSLWKPDSLEFTHRLQWFGCLGMELRTTSINTDNISIR